MKNSFAWRAIAVGCLLAFAWRGELRQIKWPPPKRPEVAVLEKPDDEAMSWVSDINVNGMMPKDRLYCADFYAALGFIVRNDDGSKKPAILNTTPKFSVFHAGSLQLAIDKGDVGRYPGLGASIDRAFFAAAGDKDEKPVDAALRSKLERCCKALAWRFAIHADL